MRMPKAASSALAVLGPSARVSGSLSVVTPGSIEGRGDNLAMGTTPWDPAHVASLSRWVRERPRLRVGFDGCLVRPWRRTQRHRWPTKP